MMSCACGDQPKEIRLDIRRRTSFARVGRRQDDRYIVEEHEDGTLVLTPAVVIAKTNSKKDDATA